MPLRHRAAILIAACWGSEGGPPEQPFMVTMPMAQSDSTTLDMKITQTAFTSSKLPKFPGSLEKDSHGHVNGHLVVVGNPRERFSVVAPMPDGCGSVQFVNKTAHMHSPRCILATDAGYYSLHEESLFDCIGNVVSDGEIANTEPMNVSNVNFGVLKNGSFVIGYITPELVESGIFQQLVAGLGWIVRNGESYVDQGWEEAYTAAGSSGDEYVSMTSGRTAVGWTAEGKLVILQYDGHTHDPSWGATMQELAEKMIQFGAVEAINLDGGGSTQMWSNGEQIGYSSDRGAYGVIADTYDPNCPIGIGQGNISAFECTRAVSTILCVHEDPAFDPERGGPASLVAPALLFMLFGLCCGAGGGFLAGKFLASKGKDAHSELDDDDDVE